MIVNDDNCIIYNFTLSNQDGIGCGADAVIQSTHKTLTSLSQTAMLHVNKGS